jgi:hypothetical protein
MKAVRSFGVAVASDLAAAERKRREVVDPNPFPGLHIMIRTIVLSAVAAISLSAPAQAQTIRVALAGKSDAQVQADLTRAVRSVCFKATRNETMALDAYSRCKKATKAASLTKLAQAKSASTALAEN